MTRGSMNEYTEAVRERYRVAGKKEKGKILDEFVRVTAYHRKTANRILLGATKRPPGKRGRPSRYHALAGPLRAIWEASDRLCSKRLQPFIPEMVRVLKHHGEQHVDLATEAELCRMSASTIDRLLKPWRKVGGRKGLSTTRPGSLLRNSIPVRTFADWTDNKPGFVEVDLVAHCGETVEGFYLNTLSAVDVASGWSECLPVWGKGQLRVQSAVHRMRRRLPFALLGVDSDNGSEFINQMFFNYCRQEKITFTRSRAYKKNDSCHVEQKNWTVVRRLVGYDRYTTKAAFERFDLLYDCVRLYVNFFQPTMKLWSKTRHGAKSYKVYEKAQTPYQRLLQMGVLSQARRAELEAIYLHLNPVQLLAQVNGHLEKLWKLADRPAAIHRPTPVSHPTQIVKNGVDSVTGILRQPAAVR